MAPPDGASQGALALVRIAGAAREESQALIEPREDCSRGEGSEAGGREFDGERKTVEADADLSHRVQIAGVELEVGLRSGRPLNEESDGIVFEHAGRGRGLRARDGERADVEDALGRDVKRLPRRDE
jgi:hypothetical protein